MKVAKLATVDAPREYMTPIVFEVRAQGLGKTVGL